MIDEGVSVVKHRRFLGRYTLYAGVSKGKIIAIGVAIVVAIGVGVVMAVSTSPVKTSQLNVTETPQGRHLELKLEEKIGVKANP